MLTAYVVTSGLTSDEYRIEGVFLDAAEAGAFAEELARHGKDNPNVEEYPVGRENYHPFWAVDIGRDGDIIRATFYTYNAGREMARFFYASKPLRCTLAAPTIEDAIARAQVTRQDTIAAGLWPELGIRDNVEVPIPARPVPARDPGKEALEEFALAILRGDPVATDAARDVLKV